MADREREGSKRRKEGGGGERGERRWRGGVADREREGSERRVGMEARGDRG